MASTIQKSHISLEAAREMIGAAEKKATEIDVPMTISICDADGNLKCLSRMDGAALLSVQVAQDKAYTSIAWGIATHEWHDFIKDDPPLLHGIVHTDRLIVFGGGYPIKKDGQVVGGIGVSGGYYTQDQDCAEAAITAFHNL